MGWGGHRKWGWDCHRICHLLKPPCPVIPSPPNFGLPLKFCPPPTPHPFSLPRHLTLIYGQMGIHWWWQEGQNLLTSPSASSFHPPASPPVHWLPVAACTGPTEPAFHWCCLSIELSCQVFRWTTVANLRKNPNKTYSLFVHMGNILLFIRRNKKTQAASFSAVKVLHIWITFYSNSVGKKNHVACCFYGQFHSMTNRLSESPALFTANDFNYRKLGRQPVEGGWKMALLIDLVINPELPKFSCYQNLSHVPIFPLDAWQCGPV